MRVCEDASLSGKGCNVTAKGRIEGDEDGVAEIARGDGGRFAESRVAEAGMEVVGIGDGPKSGCCSSC